ncbi:MAG: hypothetical protein QXN68_00825 [Thermoplasmata archaeon]
MKKQQKKDVKNKKVKKAIKRVLDEDKYNKVMCIIVEEAEKSLIEAELKGQLIDKLAYEYTNRNGEVVRGLTYWGYISCAKYGKNKLDIVFSEPEIIPVGDGKMIVKVKVSDGKNDEWGLATFDVKERFGERTALTIAKRYALDKLIPLQRQLVFLEYLRRNKPDKILKIQQPTFEEAKKVLGEDKIFEAMRSIFGLCQSMALDSEKVKKYYKDKYKVEHFNQIPIEELRKIYLELKVMRENGSKLKEFREILKNIKEE